MTADRDTKDPTFVEQIAAYDGLLTKHGIDYTRVRSGYRTYEKMDSFSDGELHQAWVHGTRELDWQGFRGQVMSLSVSPPRPEDSGFAAFERALREYFERFAPTGLLTAPTTCWITAGRFAENRSRASWPQVSPLRGEELGGARAVGRFR